MKFSINSRVLEHLGKELITSNETAVIELIKNSYDAGAHKVNMHFIHDKNLLSKDNLLYKIPNEVISTIFRDNRRSQGFIILEDNGSGMGLNELQEGFFTIASDYKIKVKNKHKQGKISDRLPLGEKGIGRLAAQRLSNILYIETTSMNSDKTYLVKIDWNEVLEQNKKLDDVILETLEFGKNEIKYTRLWFFDLNIVFNELIENADGYQLSLFDDNEKIKLKEDFQSAISFLSSPFEGELENFEINIFLNNKRAESDFKSNAINVAETVHSFSLNYIDDKLTLNLDMSLSPWFLERVHHRLIGDNELFNTWKRQHSFYAKLIEKYNDRFETSLNYVLSEEELIKIKEISFDVLKDIIPIDGKVYSFKRHNLLSKMAIDSARENKIVDSEYNISTLRDFLDYHNGIKLYRGKFRVATLGDKHSDWLELQQERTKGQQFFRFELGNVIGYVKINDPYQEYIKEISSRQDIRHNNHSTTLKKVLKKIFNDYFYQFSRSAYYIAQDIIREEKLLPDNMLGDLIKEVEKSKKEVEINKEELNNFNESLLAISQNIELATEEEKQNVRKAFENIKKTSEIFLKNIHATVDYVEKTEKLLEQAKHEKKLIELESYNNYKLMANGLITEVITHELHSLLTREEKQVQYDSHLKTVEDYLIKIAREIDLYYEHFNPIKDRFKLINKRMVDLNHFYSFLEKTFLYKGTIDDFEIEDVKQFLIDLESRIKKRLDTNKVTLDYNTIDNEWRVPRGALIHVFYNIIDNSLYWIDERRRRAKYDRSYIYNNKDHIDIKKKNDNTIYIFDSGTGVLPKYEHTLFHPLQSGKSNGRGMGLYIVKQLLKSFGANIELLPDRNKFGNRYIFCIYLQSEGDEYAITE